MFRSKKITVIQAARSVTGLKNNKPKKNRWPFLIWADWPIQDPRMESSFSKLLKCLLYVHSTLSYIFTLERRHNGYPKGRKKDFLFPNSGLLKAMPRSLLTTSSGSPDTHLPPLKHINSIPSHPAMNKILYRINTEKHPTRRSPLKRNARIWG